ncbi:MAG: uroporphyrinogen-III C-methyltransferase [Tannerellaceae bacterium]|jgi:uroporphyrinogen III methyltransferase/synthase|nr:uroporphyrinogen-III C-methyltransferase [Tannerellaceae bacterium]
MNNAENGLRVISRNSALSLLQVKEVFSFFPDISYRLSAIPSFGDKNKQISLMNHIAPDFFTRELDEAIIHGQADVAVHSAKDIPYPLPREMEVFALLEASDPTDALVSRNRYTLDSLPPGATVGTSSEARKTALLNRRPDLNIVSIRGTIEERIELTDKGLVDALIVASCALKRLGLENRIEERLPFRTHPLQGHLAVVGRKDRQEIKALFAANDVRRTYGKVYLTGFGPGNPDLLTIGGDKALAKAHVIFYDDLLDASFLSRYPGEKICTGKRKGNHRFSQEAINEQLYRAAIAGKNTVRLKGGDPLIFAHGREEADYLQSRLVEVEIIPGISSGTAFAACTHIPLTHRGVSSSVAFVTGHSPENTQTPDADTLVYYMGGAHIAGIARKLIASGRPEDTPAALAFNISLPDQQFWFSSLKELQYSLVKYPTPLLMLIGRVAAFENAGAEKQKILITGTSDEAYAHNPHAVHTPLIRIDRIADNPMLRACIREIRDFDWIIFTSRYGVRYFFETIREWKVDIRSLAKIQFASVGKTTAAELQTYQIYPDLEPANESAAGLVHCFREKGITDKYMLLPRSDKGLKYLSDELEKLGNRIADIPVYRNSPNGEAEKTELSPYRKIIFSSPSAVEAFNRLYGEMPSGIQLVAKGPTTEESIKKTITDATV